MSRKSTGPKPNRKTWVIQRLRRISLAWPPRNKVYKANRREIPRKIKKDGTPFAKPNFEHQCNICKEWFAAKFIVMDHIMPVVSVDSLDNLSEEEYIGKFAVSLLSYEDNWQKICFECHDIKTRQENELRNKK